MELWHNTLFMDSQSDYVDFAIDQLDIKKKLKRQLGSSLVLRLKFVKTTGKGGGSGVRSSSEPAVAKKRGTKTPYANEPVLAAAAGAGKASAAAAAAGGGGGGKGKGGTAAEMVPLVDGARKSTTTKAEDTPAAAASASASTLTVLDKKSAVLGEGENSSVLPGAPAAEAAAIETSRRSESSSSSPPPAISD